MRILAIRGEGLASLQAPFALELDAPPLRGQGLVAVTGPTGAGKSTLLDALCLALFDRTPRLRGRGGSPVGFLDPEDQDELRSADPRCLLRRGAVEARAEVEFLGKGGRRYLATWRVRRARRAGGGRLQDQTLELRDALSGQQLGGHRKGEVLLAIQEALGLDWAAFGRAALLAQGELAAFLRADPAGRAELLERVTGTEVYSRLSVAAHRRAGEAARELLRVQERRTALAPLPEEVRRALVLARDGARAEREAARAAREAAREALRHLRAVEEALSAEARGAAALRDAEAAWADAAPLRAALAEAEALEPLRAPLLARDRARAACEAAELALAGAEREAGEAERARAGLAARAEAARAWLREHEGWRALGEQWPRWESHLLEAQEALAAAVGLRAAAAALEARLAIGTEAAAAARASVELASRARQEAERAHAQAEEARQAVAARAGLPASPGLGRAALAARERALAELAFQLERTGRALAAAGRARAEEQAAGAAAEAARRALEELVAQEPAARARRDEAARALAEARAALDLEARRHELRPGAPCPLCGAEEHPWAVEAPALDRLARVAAERLAALEQALEELGRARAREEARAAAARSSQHAAGEAARAQTAELAAASERWVALRAELAAGTLPEDPAAASAPAALEELRLGLARLREALAAAETAEESARAGLEAARSGELRAGSALGAAEEALRAARAAREEQVRALAGEEARLRRAEEALAVALDPAPAPAGGSGGAAGAPAAPGSGASEPGDGAEPFPLFARRAARAAASPGAAGAAAAEAAASPAAASPAAAGAAASPGGAAAPVPFAGWREALRRDPAAALAARRTEAEAWRARSAELARAEAELAPAEAAGRVAAARVDERRSALSRAETELTARQAELTALASGAGADAARLALVLGRDPAWAGRTRAELQRLERRGHEAAARLELLRLRRVELEGRAPPQEEEGGAAALEAAAAREAAREARAAEALLRAEADLARDDRAREELAGLEPELRERERAAGTWGELGQLLGSHDGRKLRVFAQGLGLDALLEHANLYLERLAPRYRLLRAPGQDLELQLQDRDLGDEVRPTTGLSGGESFLVSLALALGLSSLHAGGTRIESLFIDEGLGSLDAQTQEQALATLDALQADGRQVVLITHLPGIAERLGPGVRLVPLAQGRSEVRVG